MTLVTRASTQAFVKKAKFPKAPQSVFRLRDLVDEPPLQLKANEAQSLVVGSGLVVAAAKVPVQVREDLINCTLFAQLAASGEVADPSQVTQWYGAYFRALSALGWAQSGTQFQDYEFKGNKAEASQAIIPVVTALLGPGATALTVLKTAMDSLQSLDENAPWLTLFDEQSRTERSAHFQVATAQVDDSGLLQIALLAFDLKARVQLTQVLFFKFASSSTRLRYCAGHATIYQAALEEQREAIKARLAAYRAAYVGQVKFPPPPPVKRAARSVRARA